jgi:hypothetical protein
VTLQSDPSKKGEKEIVVLEQTLKIVMEGERAVEPVIPPTTVNAPRAGNRKEFTVRLTRGGKGVPNHPFRLTTEYVDRSGGHDHLTPVRAVSRENYGHFILRRTNTHHDRPYEGQTQTNGTEVMDYVASIFGDRMTIRVDSRQNSLLWDTVSVVERVPGLMELGAGQHYELVGAPQNHTGTNDACRFPPPTSQHTRNHYGTAALIGAIQNIAAAYDSLNPGIRLRINDMSLEFGGLFDKDNNWQVPHGEHRIGRNADVSFSGLSSANRCVGLSRRQLLNAISDFTAGPTLTEGNHYHIRVN